MKILSAFVLVLFLSIPALAIQEIEGAFGLELGGMFLPEQMATANGSMTSGELIYFFKANPSYHAFSEYYVKITPTTKLIYEIVAEHEYDTSGGCSNEQETLAGLIKKKYGRVNKSDSMYTFYSVTQKPRSILISCSLFEDRLRITYNDSSLEKKAKAELVEKLAKDGSGAGL